MIFKQFWNIPSKLFSLATFSVWQIARIWQHLKNNYHPLYFLVEMSSNFDMENMIFDLTYKGFFIGKMTQFC